MRKIIICLVHQSVWATELLSAPLGIGYLKAFAEQDSRVLENFDIRILNYNKKHSNRFIFDNIAEICPDIIGFSVYGWNINNFIQIGNSYKEFNKNCKIIIGGVHVSFKTDSFKKFKSADILINGEGEETFRDLLLQHFLDGIALENIEGISYKVGQKIITTKQRKAITSLDMIPSPYMNGAIQLSNARGEPILDSVLLETSRGCPFNCAYCSWTYGQGKKINRFSIERLRKELIYFAHNRIENIVLCDSNFGLDEQDYIFTKTFVEVRHEYGYLSNLETSWTKDISDWGFRILELLKKEGIKKSFSVSLQTQSPTALKNIHRVGMNEDRLTEITEWAKAQGLDYFIELIWGLPGETSESFVNNINILSKHTYKFAVYPLIILPNTDLELKKEKYDIKTLKNSDSDFDFLLSNYSISYEDNRDFSKSILWIRVLSENMIFRRGWEVIESICNLKFFDIVSLFEKYIIDGPYINQLHLKLKSITDQAEISTNLLLILDLIYERKRDFYDIIMGWYESSLYSLARQDCREYLRELLQYEVLTLPVTQKEAARRGLEVKILEDEQSYYCTEDIEFHYDFNVRTPIRKQTKYRFSYKCGFENYMYNQEFIREFLGNVRA